MLLPIFIWMMGHLNMVLFKVWIDTYTIISCISSLLAEYIFYVLEMDCLEFLHPKNDTFLRLELHETAEVSKFEVIRYCKYEKSFTSCVFRSLLQLKFSFIKIFLFLRCKLKSRKKRYTILKLSFFKISIEIVHTQGFLWKDVYSYSWQCTN